LEEVYEQNDVAAKVPMVRKTTECIAQSQKRCATNLLNVSRFSEWVFQDSLRQNVTHTPGAMHFLSAIEL